MTKILAFSGKKQSGKNTSFNFLLGLELLKLAIVRNKIEITEKGTLRISDVFGDNDFAGIFDIDRNNQQTKVFREEYIYPFIRNYSFADKLKRDVCINLFGLSHEQCYGTDEQKNSITKLRWQDLPGVITEKPPIVFEKVDGRLGYYYSVGEHITESGYHIPLIYHEPGYMTAREVMQYVGTGIFRKMYPTIWADATIKQIQQDQSNFAIITDCRFPDEVKAVQDAGGKVIRLTRNTSDDNHPSETALDPDKFDWSKFDGIVDNNDTSISEANGQIHDLLVKWGWLDPVRLGD